MASRSFSTKLRERYSREGVAMPGGRFPIPDRDALRRAIASLGRAKGDKAAVKRHIIKRARALGATSMLPDSWRSAA